MSSITITSEFGEIEIVNEPAYTFGSADNVRRYAQEKNLEPMYIPSSVHGVILDGEPVIVLGAAGGCSGIHEHSALVVRGVLYLAVGDRLVSFALNSRTLSWVSVIDPATCFGIYYEPNRAALISHGELEVARIDEAGAILWSSGGADIFWEGFKLEPEFIAVTDFNHREYRFDYETGSSK